MLEGRRAVELCPTEDFTRLKIAFRQAKPADVVFLRDHVKRLTKRLKRDPDKAVFEFFENPYSKGVLDEAAKRHYGGIAFAKGVKPQSKP